MIRAMVVDDEGPARDRLRALLSAHEDVDVVGEAGDGLEALRAVPRVAPDVVFLDVAMPGRDGLAVASALHQGPRVVFCTAYERHAVDAFDLAADGYLLKPVSSAALARALDRVRGRVAAERRARAAASAQRSLLVPGERALGGLEVAAACRQAEGVGGDWYDVVRLPGGAVALAVGDVSGHGVDAGIFMASLQAHLEHALRDHHPSLERAVAALHARALGASGGRLYATLACVRFDPATGRIDWVVAGHPPPLLLEARGAVHPLPGGGPPVGLLERAVWRAGSRTLHAGDTIVLHTDGLGEGAEVLHALAGVARGGSAAGMRDALLAIPGSREADDDRTVLVARVAGP